MERDPASKPRGPVRRQSGELLTGTHVGDRRLRVARRAESKDIPIPELAPRRRATHPALVFVYGFSGIIFAGAIVLTTPLASADGRWTPFLDALFTATSAVCVTGLAVVDTGTYWSGIGQATVLLLIQLGGLGFMTSSTLLLLALRRQTSLRERMLLSEAHGSGGVGSVLALTKKVALFTAVAEAAGAGILTLRFLAELDPLRAVWWGVFHAVSAFNNAGFDVTGDFRSLISYQDDPVVLLTVAGLLMTGGLSYNVVEDLVRRRGFTRLSVDTKLVLVTTAALVAIGTVALLFTERNNPDTLGALPTGPRLLNAFFQAVTPRTAGFSSVDIGKVTDSGLFVMIALMFIGGASGSTAGGIKVQTFSLLFFAIVSAVRGSPHVQAFRREVPLVHVMRAIAVALLSIAVVFSAAFALSATEGFAFLRVLFEAVSAFGTVGLSTGITPETTALGRVVLILTMFTGRLGPLTLVLALAARQRRRTYRWAPEAVRIG